MRIYSLLLVCALVPCSLVGQDKGIVDIHVLAPTGSDVLLEEVRAKIGSPAQEEALELIEGLHLDLRKLVTAEKVSQLDRWMRLRSRVSVDTVDGLLLSQTLGVLIVDSLTYELSRLDPAVVAEDDAALFIPKHQQQMLDDLLRIARANEEATAGLRPEMMRITGSEGPFEDNLDRITREAEEFCERSYLKQWGENVIAMRKASGKSLWPSGLAALCEQSATEWKQIVAEPTSLKSKAYFAAVDIYCSSCVVAARSVLSKLGVGAEAVETSHGQAEKCVSTVGALRSIMAGSASENCLHNRLILK